MPLISRRIILLFRAKLFRVFQILGTFLDHHVSLPLPPSPSFSITIPALPSSTPGLIKLLFYTPPSYSKSKSNPSSKRYPLLLNFHGGGYTIGSAHDDARFFTTVLKHNPECVIVSVDYRLAPNHPFPTGIEDCAAALLHLWSHAHEYNINPSLTSLSGFSAGANFTYTVPFFLNTLSLPSTIPAGKITNIISFYPALDRTKTREERAASNPNFQLVPLPPWVAGLMDESYLHPPPSTEQLAGPLLSPGLASDELIKETLPDDITLITCWGDALLGEGEAFRERLTALGKRVAGYTVPGVIHGWDKWPTYWRGDKQRDEAYEYAALKLKEVWRRGVN